MEVLKKKYGLQDIITTLAATIDKLCEDHANVMVMNKTQLVSSPVTTNIPLASLMNKYLEYKESNSNAATKCSEEKMCSAETDHVS